MSPSSTWRVTGSGIARDGATTLLILSLGTGIHSPSTSGAQGVMSPASHLVQILLPTRTGNGQPVTQTRIEEHLHELTDKSGARPASSAPGQGLWDSGGDVERDNIAVIEVMTLVRENR
jgi:hypothetical protein